jgi:thiamine-phosphate pyrophosphorylase
MKNLSLHFIINNLHAPNGLITDVNNAISAGVHVVHYNDKKLRKRQIVENAYILSALCRKSDVLFLMQDYPDIASLVGADGVHITEQGFSIAHIRRMLGPDKIIGVDFSSLRQAVDAEEDGVNYLCLNLMKENTTLATKKVLSKIEKLKEILTVPIIAMGEFPLETIQDLTKAGINGIGMLSPNTEQNVHDSIKEMLTVLHHPNMHTPHSL